MIPSEGDIPPEQSLRQLAIGVTGEIMYLDENALQCLAVPHCPDSYNPIGTDGEHKAIEKKLGLAIDPKAGTIVLNCSIRAGSGPVARDHRKHRTQRFERCDSDKRYAGMGGRGLVQTR